MDGKLADINLVIHGPVATHRMPCATCGQRPAVYIMNTGRFQPCWKCQREGWATVKRSKLRQLWDHLRGDQWKWSPTPTEAAR